MVKKEGSVKAHRFEIVGFSGDPAEVKARWIALAERCREFVNFVWQRWETYHINKGNDYKVRQFVGDLARFRRKEISKKPRLDIQAVPKDLGKYLYKQASTEFKEIHARIQVLLLNVIQKRMAGRDVGGKWNIWISVLTNKQGRPSAERGQPIPFDSQNAEIVTDGEKNYFLSVRLTRVEKTPGKHAESILDRFTLKARGSGAVILRRVIDGEYDFCGSSIVRDASRGKWYALLAYRMPITKSNVRKSVFCVLRAGKKKPWLVRYNGHSFKFGGGGEAVEALRKRLLTSRWSIQANYRWAGSANKGHGRKRALLPIGKLSRGWKDFVKSYNHGVTARLVTFCINERIGKIVYVQPTDESPSRFLARTGKVPGRQDSTSWDWAQVKTFLAYKCKEAGIHFECRKRGDNRYGENVRSLHPVRKSNSSKPKGCKAAKA